MPLVQSSGLHNHATRPVKWLTTAHKQPNTSKTAVRKLHKCIQPRMCVRQWIAQWALQQAGENRRKTRQAGTDAQPLQLQSAEDLGDTDVSNCIVITPKSERNDTMVNLVALSMRLVQTQVWCYTQQNDCIILLQIATSNWKAIKILSTVQGPGLQV